MGTCVSVPVVGGVGRPSAGRVAVRVDLPALKPCEANGAGQAAHQWPQSRPLGKALAQLRTFKASGSQRFRLAALLNGAPPADGACDAAAVAGAEPREPTPATRPGGASALRLALFSPRLHDSAQSVSGKPRGGGGAARRRRPLGARLRGRDAAAADPFAATAAADGGPPQRVALRDLVTGEIIPDFGVDGVFDVLQLLGSGGAGCTYLCRDLATKDLVAVKFMQRPLPKLAVPLLLREVDLQSRLGQGHPNVVQAHELVLTENHLALVMEFAQGGTLTDLVASRWESALERGGLHLEEAEARFFFRQFVSAVEYCHGNRVAHRDLKLDNTLLDGPLAAPHIKLCDFGFARQWGPDGSGDMHTALGTPAYMSPQTLGSKYGNQGFDGAAADVWASGIMLFVMLFGCFPFEHDKHKDPNSEEAHLEVRMAQEKLSWRDNHCASAAISRGVLSVECADLLDKLLAKDESKRMGIDRVKAHPWLKQPLASEAHAVAWDRLQSEESERRATCQQPRAAAQLKRLKAAVLAMMAAATRTAADAPLFGQDALSAAAAPHSGGPQRPPASAARAHARRRRRLRHESTPTVAQLGALAAPACGRIGSDCAPERGAAVDGAPGGLDAGARASIDTAVPVPICPQPLAPAAAPPFCSQSSLSTAESFGSAVEDAAALAPGSGLPSHAPAAAPGGKAAAADGLAAADDAGPNRSGDGGADQRTLPSPSAYGSSPSPTSTPAGGPLPAPAAAPRLPPWGIQDARPGGGGLVWRLPLVVWAPDEALRVPLPELQVAAGALIKQLQASQGGSKPRLGALCKRMSWPMAPGASNSACGASAIAGL